MMRASTAAPCPLAKSPINTSGRQEEGRDQNEKLKLGKQKAEICEGESGNLESGNLKFQEAGAEKWKVNFSGF